MPKRVSWPILLALVFTLTILYVANTNNTDTCDDFDYFNRLDFRCAIWDDRRNFRFMPNVIKGEAFDSLSRRHLTTIATQTTVDKMYWLFRV